MNKIPHSPPTGPRATVASKGNPEVWLELACGLEAILVGLLRLIADRLCLPDRLTAPLFARMDRAMARLKRHIAALAAGQIIPQRARHPSHPPPLRRRLGLLERLRQKSVFHAGRLAARLTSHSMPAPVAETSVPPSARPSRSPQPVARPPRAAASPLPQPLAPRRPRQSAPVAQVPPIPTAIDLTWPFPPIEILRQLRATEAHCAHIITISKHYKRSFTLTNGGLGPQAPAGPGQSPGLTG